MNGEKPIAAVSAEDSYHHTVCIDGGDSLQFNRRANRVGWDIPNVGPIGFLAHNVLFAIHVPRTPIDRGNARCARRSDLGWRRRRFGTDLQWRLSRICRALRGWHFWIGCWVDSGVSFLHGS
jgi:hypothetical protein